MDALVQPVVGGAYVVDGDVVPEPEPESGLGDGFGGGIGDGGYPSGYGYGADDLSEDDPLGATVAGGISIAELRALLEIKERPDDADARWARRLRRFARIAVWALPAGAIMLALTGVWGWPTSSSEGGGASPGTWLVWTVLGLLFAAVGAIALTALLAAGQAVPWAVTGLGLALAGTVFLAPVLGVLGLARPSVSRLSGVLTPDVRGDLESRFFGGGVTRWLGVGGLILLGAGWLLLACAVLASGVLNRMDGYLLAGAVAVATLAGYAHWQFLVVISAMLALAAGLGLAWTASRLTPDGVAPLD